MAAATLVCSSLTPLPAAAAPGARLFTVTCYSPPAHRAGKSTASGAPVGPGSIAAPRTIAFGTPLSVPGWGNGTVVDRGGSIRGNRLDVWIDSLDECRRWGRRRVMVTWDA